MIAKVRWDVRIANVATLGRYTYGYMDMYALIGYGDGSYGALLACLA